MDVLLHLKIIEPLAASQINQVQSRVKAPLLEVSLCLLDEDPKDRVATRTMLMAMRLFVNAVLFTVVDQEHRLVKVFDLLEGQAHHVGPEVCVAHDFQVGVVLVE